MTIRLKIPLTLAIVPALIVRSANERFAIPQVKLVELVRVDSFEENASNEIQMLQGQPVIRLRGSLLPLVSLNKLLQLEENDASESSFDAKTPSGVTNIAVLNADSGQFGLIVDSIEDSTDIVVKPLSGFLKGLGVYSGATVLGDGSVALVLDVIGLAAHGHIFDETSFDNQATKGEDDNLAPSDITEYLVVDVGVPGRFAIPLCLVIRLEEFRKSAIERAGNQRVVRYRGAILPIISVANHLDLEENSKTSPKGDDSDMSAVVVVERAGRHFGLEVERIIDVIAIDALVDTQVKDRSSILGTSIHADGVVVIIDAHKIIDETFFGGKDMEGQVRAVAHSTPRATHHILFVEDNSFFRNHIQKTLTDAGYKVTIDVNGENAWKRLQRSKRHDFSLVLSDIEMPKMTGLQLAEKVRTLPIFSDLPMVAITTKSRDSDREIGFKCGFNKYLEKLNGEKLIAEIDESLGIDMEQLKYGT